MSQEQEGYESFFQTVYDDIENFDQVRFLTEVQAQFRNEEVQREVKARLDVLNQLANKPELAELTSALRIALTRVFTAGGDESAVLARLQDLTEVRTADGKAIDLRSFLKSKERKVYSEGEYREVLGKKIRNTNLHVVNLMAYFPQAEKELRKLSKSLKELTAKINDVSLSGSQVKKAEEEVRQSGPFSIYEDMKDSFLKDWLKKFANLSEGEVEGLSPGDIQRMIQEHQRHQVTKLLKAKIRPVDLDMSSYLGPHDTLEGEFKDAAFWKGCNVNARRNFVELVLAVVQSVGMLKGQRYSFFQSDADNELYLLFGLALPNVEDISEDPITMVPYIKPFTRKGTYLLEIRKRDINDPEEYYHELVHYTLPFIYGLDQMDEFKVGKELLAFFNTRY